MSTFSEPSRSAVEIAVDAVLHAARIGDGGVILAAVSGGPDSTALLRALAALRSKRAFALVACIVDHGIRPPEVVASDIAFARRLCGGLQVPLSMKAVPAGECEKRARDSRRSLEEEARDTRHALLREAAEESGADVIALGHTQDDVVETMLMRVMQGSDVHGLRGIPSRRGPFVRPMLDCTRKQVLQYLDSLRQGWCEDASNEDTRILRNRVRRRLVPLLDEEFPGFRTGLLVLSRKLSLSADLVQKLGSGLQWKRSDSGFSIDTSEFLAAHPSVRLWSLLRLYNRFSAPGAPRRLPWRFLSPIANLEAVSRDGILLQGHGATLCAGAGRLDWGPDIASRCKKGYFIVVSEARRTEIREAGISITCTRGPDPDEGRGGIVILAGMVRPPLVVRSKRKGDSIRLAGGSTSVKELLIGMKVPESERGRIPILADRSGVLAVLGGPLGYGTRARADILAGDRARVDRMVVHVDQYYMEEGREQQR